MKPSASSVTFHRAAPTSSPADLATLDRHSEPGCQAGLFRMPTDRPSSAIHFSHVAFYPCHSRDCLAECEGVGQFPMGLPR